MTPFPHRWGMPWLFTNGMGCCMVLLVGSAGLMLNRPVFFWASVVGSPLLLTHMLSLRDIPRMLEMSPDGLWARTFTGREVSIAWQDLTDAASLDGSGWWRDVRQLRLDAPAATLLMVAPVPGFDKVRSEAALRIGLREEREFNGWRHHLRWWWLPFWDQSARFKRFEDERPSRRGSGEIEAILGAGADPQVSLAELGVAEAVDWREARWKRGLLMAFLVLVGCVGGPMLVLDGRLSPMKSALMLAFAAWAVLSTVMTFRECIASMRLTPEGFQAVTYGGRRVEVPWRSVESVERWPRGGRRIVSRGARSVYLPTSLDRHTKGHTAIVAGIDRCTPTTAGVGKSGLARFLRW